MTDRKELEKLIAKLRTMGAEVSVYNCDGHIHSVRVLGLKGFGPHPMSPISFAERAREVIGHFVTA